MRLDSASKRSDGKPRFTLVLDPVLAASDHGLRFLIQQETRHDGFERATREVIDAHLRPGDLFIDVGAHVGAIALSAATAPLATGADNPVLAIEPSPENQRQLASSIAANGLDDRVTLVPAAVGRATGKATLLLSRGSMGHRLAPESMMESAASEAVEVPVFSLDDLLAQFPEHDHRRVVVKIDVEGREADVIAGAAKLLASGRLRLVIWEKLADGGPALQAAAALARHGFASFMFAYHDWGGPLIPFVMSPAIGNVFSFAGDERRLPSYPRDIRKRPPYNVAYGMPPAQDQLLAYAEALRQAGASDGSRWANWQALEPGALERAEAAAPFIPPGAHLLDLGAGRMALRARLPIGAQYQPADLVAWSADCITVDLNAGPFPAGRYEVVAALGLLEYLHNPAALLTAARNAAYRLIVTYPVYDSRLPITARRGYGWMNDIDLSGFEAMLANAGWRISQRKPLGEAQFWVCEAGPA